MFNKKLKIFFLFSIFSLLFVPFAEAQLTEQDAKEIWAKVAAATDLTALPFTVKSDDKTPNAWVTNGSSVTVTTGLLNLLEKRSELYGVLAHEAGHAKLGHHQSTVNKATGLSVASLLLERLFGSSLGGSVASTAVNVGANLAYAGWSREQEVEADDYAVRLAHKNGEDPVGLYTALQRLSSSGRRAEPSGFNSHPPDERRLLHIKNEILKVAPDTEFPGETAGQTEGVSQNPQKSVEASKTADVPIVKQKAEEKKEDNVYAEDGHYDINAAIERMKKRL
ncbi:MAG: M48 family metalloprotease [Synergistaceae bacterium]|nr:M48 family metalloprotease [Synergistaceae bacterium]